MSGSFDQYRPSTRIKILAYMGRRPFYGGQRLFKSWPGVCLNTSISDACFLEKDCHSHRPLKMLHPIKNYRIGDFDPQLGIFPDSFYAK